MKLAIAVILALVCHMAMADVPLKVCTSAKQFYNGTGCYDCPTPCEECVFKNGKVSCINCGVNTGKFLEIKDDIGSCNNCTGNCSTCRGPAVSDCYAASATDLKISPTVITKCDVAGCLYCNSENKCAKCKVSFRLAEDKCTACQNTFCADCSESVSTCKKCGLGTELKNNTCSPCEQGCKSCPCKDCMPGFRFSNNTCEKCDDGFCLACSANKTQCTACATGFFLANGTCTKCDTNCKECTALDKCGKCDAKFVSKNGKCTACTGNCDECNANDECTKCSDNYFPSADKKTCTICPDGCDGCTGPEGKCAKCKPGYLPKPENKGCEACTTSKFGCQECNNATTCKTCQDGYVLDTKGQCNSIATCSVGKALNGEGVCVDGTIDNCAKGNNVSASCFQCGEGYYPKDKGCSPCPNGCRSCTVNKGNVVCDKLAQTGFSKTVSTNGKTNTGYLGKNLVYTVKENGDDDKCMPNTFRATYTKETTKKKCLDYDKCPILQMGSPEWVCYIEGNAVKMTLSLFAVVIASLFTL